MTGRMLSRRRFAQAAGIVIATFALSPHLAIGQTAPNLPFSLRNNRGLEGWIRLEADETVVIFTGKAELGQGILTALAQIAAEELDVGFGKIRMIGSDILTHRPEDRCTISDDR